jgi:hypothetical protein
MPIFAIRNVIEGMSKRPFLLLLFVSFLVLAKAQRDVTTLSGQKIVLFSNGTWENMPKGDEAVESPVINGEFSNDITDTELGFISTILASAQKKEIETFVMLDQLEKDFTINQIATNQAKLVKDKPKLKILKNETKLLKSRIVATTKVYEKIAMDISNIKNIKNLKFKERTGKIKEYNNLYPTDIGKISNNKGAEAVVNPPSPALNTMEVQSIEPKSTISPKIQYDPSCKITIDNKINKLRHLATDHSPFFRFTPEKLKSYFKDKELMEVSVNMEKIGKQHNMVVTIKIISKDAAKNYGMIQKENMLKATFISGKSIVLNASDDARSTIETYTGHSVYNIKYLMEKEDIDIFTNVPLDTVGIMWSSGYETYDIYNVDVIMNQLKCLKSYENQ